MNVPDKYFHKGITLKEIFNLFPDNAIAEKKPLITVGVRFGV